MADVAAVRPFPATAKGRETRRRIVDAAADLIYERGVANVSLDDVCQATGTSKSQLYHYFGDKDGLVHDVIDRQRERVLAFHGPQLGSLSSWDDIQRWRDAVVEVQADRGCRSGCPLGSLANELAELDAGAREQLSRRVRDLGAAPRRWPCRDGPSGSAPSRCRPRESRLEHHGKPARRPAAGRSRAQRPSPRGRPRRRHRAHKVFCARLSLD